MDPATLAATVTMFLIPFLSKVGENIADQTQKQLPEKVSQVWDTIVSKFRDKPAAQGSAHDLHAQPGNPDNQEAFTVQLKKTLKDDPQFAAALEELLQTAQATVYITNTGSGAVATQNGVAGGAGGIAIRGNVGGNVVAGNNNSVINRNAEDGNKREQETSN